MATLACKQLPKTISRMAFRGHISSMVVHMLRLLLNQTVGCMSFGGVTYLMVRILQYKNYSTPQQKF